MSGEEILGFIFIIFIVWLTLLTIAETRWWNYTLPDTINSIKEGTSKFFRKLWHGSAIDSVLGEPTTKETSDGRVLSFIEIKMKNGERKQLYKDTGTLYGWCYADTHQKVKSPAKFDDTIYVLLRQYRIDHAKVLKNEE